MKTKLTTAKIIYIAAWVFIFQAGAGLLVGVLMFSEVIKPEVEAASKFTTDPLEMFVFGFFMILLGILIRWKAKEMIEKIQS